ncbi:hypothetical protein BESB_084220 [Besnoitia besnoiti]|uniref:Endonuclease/exonuclease/phosphatase family protein n=1 Tax=Besnoitia besnoiti TaxID=94643 RepID=A0A2A9MC27_BESBE|nr:hypothetical protein BESB_084220 [Besnoitia besnoiti]PFH33223.1 hypothetical protein BESB_084220 [Besnoitia besnoiti]
MNISSVELNPYDRTALLAVCGLVIQESASKDIPDEFTKEDLIGWAADPGSSGLLPGYPVVLESCGDLTEAKLYEKKQGHNGHIGSIRQAYAEFVENFHEEQAVLQKAMEDSHLYKALNLVFFQWNAEFLLPTVFEVLQPFIPGNGAKVDVNDIDVVFITMQENCGMGAADHKHFIQQVVKGLNVLSEEKTWDTNSSTYREMGNLFGTKACAHGPLANHQSIYVVSRRSILRLEATTTCEWGMNMREKGFVAISIEAADMGRILALGIHLPTLKEEQSAALITLLKKVVAACVPSKHQDQGLDYFDGGVYLVGDFNSRLSNPSVDIIFKNLKRRTDYDDVFSLPPPPAGESVLAHQLLYIMKYEREDKDTRFAPLLWAADSLGGSNEVEGTSGDLRTPLLAKGFSLINVCYGGAFSYSWLKKCSPSATETTRKVKEAPGNAGYLDRIAIRMPSASLKRSDTPTQAPSFLEGAVFLVFAGQLVDFRSDHFPQVFVVRLMKKVHRPW